MRRSVLTVMIAMSTGCAEPVTAPKPGDPADLAANAGAAGPATRFSVPERDYLLEVTALAARRSTIGDLRNVDFHAEDVELRFWGGYGLVGTSGLVVTRRKGKWSALRADMKQCFLTVPMSVGDTLSPASEERYERLAYDTCPNTMIADGGRFFSTEKLVLTRLPVPPDMPALWDEAVRDGLYELPTGVERNWIMLDGHSFVVEVRRGSEYRVTEIACVRKPENDVDVRVQQIGKMFQNAFRDAWGLSCS